MKFRHTDSPAVAAAKASFLANFLEAVDLPVDPSMVLHPRMNPYVRTDDWDEQAAKSGTPKAA